MRRAPARIRTLVPAVAAAALMCLAGCSSAGPSTAARHSVTTTSVLTPAVVSRNLVIDGRSYPVPSEDGVHAIDPSVATGGQIVLTNKGFLPYRLFAQLNQKITWTNLSSHPVRITFLHLPQKSGLIPVGGTYTFSSPHLINFIYTSSSGFHGVVAIGAFTG